MSESGGLQFNFEWRTTLFTALLLPLLVWLGFWQLDRAEQKSELAAVWDNRQSQPAIPLDALWSAAADELAYRPVMVTGQFDPQHYLLLDNRIQQGKFGYEVVAVFNLQGAGDRRVLVNRGWLAGDAARRELPKVSQPDGLQTLTGTLYVAPGDPYLLGEQALSGEWPLVLQALEMDKLGPALASRLGGEFYRHSLRLEENDAAALVANWPVVNVSSAKHNGYAVQWFSMAAALLLLFVLRSSNLWRVLRPRSKREM